MGIRSSTTPSTTVKISTSPAPLRHPDTSGVLPAASLKGPSLMKGPVTKKPWVSPISTPLSTGATPVLYAGRFDKKLATIGAEVTGVSIMPMKGSPLIGLTTWFFASALATTTPLTPALSCFCFDTVLDTAILGLVLGDKAKPFPWPKPRTQLADRTVILQVNVSVCSSKCVGMLLRMRLLLTSLSLSLSLSLSFFLLKSATSLVSPH